jgi:hypothetical protein
MADRPTHFFRIVESNPPTLWDFLSAARRGRQLRRRTPELERLFAGISLFETFAQARDQAQVFPQLGEFIAEIVVPNDLAIDCERTTRTEGHWTIWARPDTLLSYVILVTKADVVA